MSDAVQAILQPGSAELEQRVAAVPLELVRTVSTMMGRLTIEMQRQIVMEKLRGAVLHWRTGKLARSVHQDVQVDGSQVVGSVYAGKDAPYGMVHEYGGTFQVPSHQRTVVMHQGRQIAARQITRKSRRAALLAAASTVRTVTVRAYTVTYPERSFMRTTLAEYAARFRERAQLVLTRSVRGQG